MRLLRYEFYKIFDLKRFCLIVLAVLIQIVTAMTPRTYVRDYSEKVYRTYMEELAGEYTEEKHNLVLERYDEICCIVAEHDDVISAYKRDEITLEAFDEHNFEYNKALSEMSTVEYILQKCDYYKSRGEGVFFYDVDWGDFLGRAGYNYITALVVLCLVIPIFENEYKSEAVAMLLTTKKGRNKVCVAKIFLAGTVATAVSLLLSMTKYVGFAWNNGEYAEMGVGNLLGYGGFPNISLEQYYWNDTVIKASTWLIAAMFICVVNTYVRNAVFAFFISFVMLVCPYFISELVNGKWVGMVFLSGQLGGMYSDTLNITVLTLIYLFKGVVYSVMCMKKWSKAI